MSILLVVSHSRSRFTQTNFLSVKKPKILDVTTRHMGSDQEFSSGDNSRDRSPVDFHMNGEDFLVRDQPEMIGRFIL